MKVTVVGRPPRAPSATGKRQWSHALFGYDVFISYTRRDAREYANALALKLSGKHDLVVFLDDQEFDVGERLPELLRAVRRSRMVVVLASPQVGLSQFVPKEVAAAQEKRRRVIPIDFAATLASGNAGADLQRALQEGKWETESNALADGPSQPVEEAILRSSGGLRRKTQQRLFFSTIFAVLVMLTTSAFRLAYLREQALDAETLRTKHARHLSYASQLLLASELAPRDPARARTSLDDVSRAPADLRDVTWGLISATAERELWTAPEEWGRQTLFDYAASGELISASNNGIVRRIQPDDFSAETLSTKLDGQPLWFDSESEQIVVLTASDDLSIWSLKSGSRTLQIPVGRTKVTSAALSRDGRTLVGVTEKSVRFWDVATGAELRPQRFDARDEMEDTLTRITAVHPADDAHEFIVAITRIFGGGEGYAAEAYRVRADGKATRIVRDDGAIAARVSSARAGDRIAIQVESRDTEIGQYSGLSRVLVNERDTSKRPFVHRLTTDKVTALRLDMKGERLALATTAGLIRIVDSVSGNVQTEVPTSKDTISLAFDSSGGQLAVLSKAGQASVQLTQAMRPMPTVDTSYGDPPLYRVRHFHRQGEVVIYTWSALVDDSLGGHIVLDRATGLPLRREPFYYSADFLDAAHDPGFIYTDILPGVAGVAGDREWLVEVGYGHLDWSPIKQAPPSFTNGDENDPHRSAGRRDESRRLQVSPDGRQLAVIRYAGPEDESALESPTREHVGPWTLEIVDTRNPRLVSTLWNGRGYPSDLAWSPDGTRLTMALATGGIRIWHHSDWALSANARSGSRARLSFPRRGTTLAATWQSQPTIATLALIDTKSGRVTRSFSLQTAGIDVVLSLSESRVAIGHRDGRVTIVDTTDGDVRTAGGPAGTRVVGLELSDDQKTLLVTRLRAGDQLLCSLADAEFGHDLLELQVNGEPARAAAFLAAGRGVVLASDDQLFAWLVALRGGDRLPRSGETWQAQ